MRVLHLYIKIQSIKFFYITNFPSDELKLVHNCFRITKLLLPNKETVFNFVQTFAESILFLQKLILESFKTVKQDCSSKVKHLTV